MILYADHAVGLMIKIVIRSVNCFLLRSGCSACAALLIMIAANGSASKKCRGYFLPCRIAMVRKRKHMKRCRLLFLLCWWMSMIAARGRSMKRSGESPSKRSERV